MSTFAIRRADFMLVLAHATELATGQSRDFALRSCALAMRIADLARLDERERRKVWHQAILRYIGCNADSHLLAAAVGDEIALRRDLAVTDMGSHAEIGAAFVKAFNRHFAGLPPDELAAAVKAGLAEVLQVSVPILSGHCEVAQRIGQRIGLPGEILENLGQLYERWDGHGLPRGLKGEEVHLAVRLVTLAQDVVSLTEAHGVDAMLQTIAKRRDGPYEAALADLFLAHAEQLLAGLGAVDHAAVRALEPLPHAFFDEAGADEAFTAIADMIDMRMPFTLGHSRAVASLADAAGRHMGLPEAEVRALRWAACVHDLGELAVPVSVWMKAAPFSPREADAARLHPYHGERALTPLGEQAGAVPPLVLCHHERLDGSGYHRQVRAQDLSAAARILACAEAFQTAREARPHRDALSDAAAAARLRTAVREGRLCAEATEAVLACAGQPARRASLERYGGLTPREIEVLRLIAAGHTVKEAARELDIAPKTADNHIQNLYSKIGVTTRAGAALYAVERGLVDRGISPA